MWRVLVYNDDRVQIGTGFFIQFADDSITEADLIDMNGERLAEGWYQLKVMDESYSVVVPTREQ